MSLTNSLGGLILCCCFFLPDPKVNSTFFSDPVCLFVVFFFYMWTIGEGGEPSRSNYTAQPSTSGSTSVTSGANGYAHNFTTERVKSPSPTANSHRSSASSSRKESAARATSNNSKSSRSSHYRDESSSNISTARSRSPPVVTIAPTLNSGLHYQDSRKVGRSKKKKRGTRHETHFLMLFQKESFTIFFLSPLFRRPTIGRCFVTLFHLAVASVAV